MFNHISFLNVPEEKPIEVEEEEEEVQKTPGNLLDNLFRKTKTVPCLYWMPLSDDQVCRPHPPTPTTSYPPPLPLRHTLPVPISSVPAKINVDLAVKTCRTIVVRLPEVTTISVKTFVRKYKEWLLILVRIPFP